MKKKMSLGLMIAFVLAFATGCAIKSTGLTEAEMNQVAEYTAKLILKHTRGYEPNLQESLEVKDDPALVKEEFGVIGEEKPSSEEKTEEKEEEKKPQEENKEEASKEEMKEETKEEKPEDMKAKSLSEIYAVKEAEVVYGGSGEYKRYPENEGYFSLVSPEDRKLFVTKFVVKNMAESKLHFTHGKEIQYRLTLKDGSTYKPSVTLLENDMKFLDLNIDKGKSASGVIVFNIPKKLEVKDAKLEIQNKDLRYEILISH